MHKKCCSCNYWEKDRCDFSFLLLILHSHIAFLTTVFPFFISAMSDYFLCNCLFLSSFRNLNFTVLSKRVCLIHYFCTIVIVLIFNSSLFWLDVPFFNWLDMVFPGWPSKIPQKSQSNNSNGTSFNFQDENDFTSFMAVSLHSLSVTHVGDQSSAFYLFSYWFYWCWDPLCQDSSLQISVSCL